MHALFEQGRFRSIVLALLCFLAEQVASVEPRTTCKQLRVLRADAPCALAKHALQPHVCMYIAHVSCLALARIGGLAGLNLQVDPQCAEPARWQLPHPTLQRQAHLGCTLQV